MGMFNRIRRALSQAEYANLPKNIRVTPEGEVLPKFDKDGRELLDPVPMAPPVGWFKQPSMFDHIRDMVRSEHVRMFAEAQGSETWEEAQDFDVEDETFPTSQYEGDFEPMEDLQERRNRQFRERWLADHEETEYGRWVSREEEAGRLPRKAPSSPEPAPGARPPAKGSPEPQE